MRTQIPRWLTPAPRELGNAGIGSLGANEWHSVITVYLPTTLIRLWGDKDGMRERAMLDNFMHLVTAITIAGMGEMTQSLIELYQSSMSSYLTTFLHLYKESSLKPNHHLAVHLGRDVLPRYGPLHPIRAYATERMNFVLQSENTNSKFGGFYILDA